PAIVGKSLIGLRHPVRVFALLHGAAAKVRRVEQLVCQLLLHRLTVAARSGVSDDPTNAERETTIGVDLDRDLIVRPSDAPRFDLKAWFHVVDRLLEHL